MDSGWYGQLGTFLTECTRIFDLNPYLVARPEAESCDSEVGICGALLLGRCCDIILLPTENVQDWLSEDSILLGEVGRVLPAYLNGVEFRDH